MQLLDLLCDFEDDVEFYRHAEREAGDTDDDANRCFLDAEDVAKQIGGGVGDLGLVEEVASGCDVDSEPDDTGDFVE